VFVVSLIIISIFLNFGVVVVVVGTELEI